MAKKNSKRLSLQILIRKYLTTILLLLILLILVLNHLNIILYVRKNDCNSNQTDFVPSEIFLNFPHSFEPIEHLASKKDNQFKPQILITSNRKAKFVLGIPTLKRENVTYLDTMLSSLLLAMNEHEKSQVLIVILLAEATDRKFNKETLKILLRKYKNEIESGFIDVISAPRDYYPNESREVKDEIFNDKPERIKWRTKQNFDICFLMAYSRGRGTYYLQVGFLSLPIVSFSRAIRLHCFMLQHVHSIKFSPTFLNNHILNPQ